MMMFFKGNCPDFEIFDTLCNIKLIIYYYIRIKFNNWQKKNILITVPTFMKSSIYIDCIFLI